MRLTLLVSTLALVARPVAADLAFCATENTGSSYSAGMWTSATWTLHVHFANEASVSNTYQSNGACQRTCAGYALGILQGKKCWCSNVAPSSDSQKDVSECSTGCPGYPADSCGSASKGVWAYVEVPGGSISSTTSDSGSSTTTSPTSSVSSSCSFIPLFARMWSRWTTLPLVRG